MFLSTLINKKQNKQPPISINLGDIRGNTTLDLSTAVLSADSYKMKIIGDTTINFRFGVRDKFFLLVLENAGNFTVTFPSYIKWNQKVIPDFTRDGIDHIYISKMSNFDGASSDYVTASVLSDMGIVV